MESSVLVLILALCLPYCQCVPTGMDQDLDSYEFGWLIEDTDPGDKEAIGWLNRKNETKCYPPLGCLTTTKEWYSTGRPFNPLPESREAVGTNFKLYTRDNLEGETLEVDKNKDVHSKYFNPYRGTKFVIHGFLEKGSKDWLMQIMEALLQRFDVNVILVDWEKGARPLYKDATGNTRLVGLEIAYLVNTLIEKQRLSARDVHLIGHSLGAHIAGYAGEKIKDLARITGLDPAGPYFRNMPTFVRLDPSDASLVDAIRTDSHYGFGSTPQQLGHLDFYPNGGESQPLCILPEGRLSERRLPERRLLGFPICSHHRSVLYFLESILSSPYYEEGEEDKCPFTSFGCKSYKDFLRGKCSSCGNDGTNCALMGMDADRYPGLSDPRFKENKFFLKTNSKSPFCGYHYRVKLTLGSDGVRDKVAGNLTFTAVGDGGIATDISLTSGPQTFSKGETYSLLGFSPVQTGKVSVADVEWEWNANSIVNRRSRKMDHTRNLQLSEAAVTNLGYYPPDKFKTSRTCKPSDSKAVGNGDRYNFQFNC